MSLPKQSQLSGEVFTVVYPDKFPRIPESYLAENEELRVWQQELDDFWVQLSFALSRERETIMDEIAKIKAELP